MPNYNISDASSWETVAGLSLSSGDTVKLLNNITFTSGPSVITLEEGVTFLGEEYTLFTNYSSPGGLFIFNGGTVKNLTVDGGGQICQTNHGFFADYQSNQWGTLLECVVRNGTLSSGGGGFVGNGFGNTSNVSYITKCETSVALDTSNGGLAGIGVKNLVIENCYAHCPDKTGGSFVGGLVGYSGGDLTINNCYVSTSFSSASGTLGGIMGTNSGSNCTITINRCYVTGNIGNGCGGIFGRLESSRPNVTVNVNDCYVTGNISGTNAYGCGSLMFSNPSGQTVGLTNFYQSGTVSGSWGVALARSNDGTINASGVYVTTSNLVLYGNAISGSVVTNLTAVDAVTLPGGWSASIWQASDSAGDGDYARLKAFGDTTVWSGYTGFASHPTLTSTMCFLPGTRIRIPGGYKYIEHIQPGDFIISGDGRHLPVVFNNGTKIDLANSDPINAPVIIKRHAFDYNYPKRDTYASRFHKILIENRMVSCETLLLEGTYYDKLIDTQGKWGMPVTYYNLLLPQTTDTYIANGMIVESLDHRHKIVGKLL